MRITSSLHQTTELSAKPEAGRRWEVLRIVLGAMYLLGAVTHILLGILAPELYQQFANQALVAIYTNLWQSFVVPYLAILQPLVTAFEIGVAVALWWRGRAVRIGHAAGAAFQAGLVLSGPWGPVNALLTLLHVAALRRSYPTTVRRFVQRRGTEMSG